MFTIKHSKGFSMIEILVALVILAIGLLGMATLMVNSLQTNQSAAMRSAATLAAYDLIERMRSNTDAVLAGNYARSLQETSQIGGSNQPAPSCDNCTAQALASHDLEIWAYALNKEAIPGSKVIIKSDGEVQGQNRLWCIGILWEDTGGKPVTDGNDTACGAKEATNNRPWAFYEIKVLL